MYRVLVATAFVTTFICGFLVRPAVGIESLVANGTWWKGLNADEKTASVMAMVSAYNSGYINGRTDQLVVDKPYVDFRLRAQHLSPYAIGAKEEDWFYSSIGPERDHNFSKPYKTYVDSLDDFYDNNPDLLNFEVGALIGCNTDHAKYKCDEAANMSRHPPTPYPMSTHASAPSPLPSVGSAATRTPIVESPHARFQFEGLRLGMTSTEAQKALGRRGGNVWTTSKRPCTHDYLEAARKGLAADQAASNCTQLILYREPYREYTLAFIEDYPQKPGQSILIALSISLINKTDNLSSEVLKRFGSPEVVDDKKPWVAAMWCAERCSMKDFNVIGSGTSIMLTRGSEFDLIDDSYSMARYNAIQKVLRVHGIFVSP